MAALPESGTSSLEQPGGSRNEEFQNLVDEFLDLLNDQGEQSATQATFNQILRITKMFILGVMIATEIFRGLEPVLRRMLEKKGTSPASKVSIEAMRKVMITLQEKQGDEVCVICLEGWKKVGLRCLLLMTNEVGGNGGDGDVGERERQRRVDREISVHLFFDSNNSQ
ncbi:hypothetical protein BVC80_9097g51 [Macleaya cordata]|uniref:Uncharacterized protein n=1 Tax=Macleaya cordata TaxID=56857 RepID=A0A200QER3_MACCD|nr:hypothetical protein BVC80_9097g51 [Macleaya cordata]